MSYIRLHNQDCRPFHWTYRMLFSNAVLQIRWAGNGFPFHPVSETLFFIDFFWFADDDFRFELDDTGRVRHLVFEDYEGNLVKAEKVH